MSDPLPSSKLFFRIGEVAGLVGVEPHVLRYWEREFRSIRPTKSAKGQRVYSRKDVENLLRVRDLLYRDGFTIAGAKKRMQRPGDVAASEVEIAESAEETEGAAVMALETDDEERPSASLDPLHRHRLTALRAEVEAFLDELEPVAPSQRERA